MKRARKKRKPDTVQLNFVRPTGGDLVRVTKVCVPARPAVTTASQGSKDADTCSDHLAPDAVELDPLGDETDNPILDNDTCPVGSDPSTDYEKREVRSAEAWAAIRSGLVKRVIESAAHPEYHCCQICQEKDAPVWCQDCSATYCTKCALELHSSINLFHMPTLWSAGHGMYVPVELPVPTLPQSRHCCDSCYLRSVTCIGGLGVQREVNFSFCSCYSEPEVLAQHGYFAATPKQPRLAFQFQLLDLLEALLVECQVALKDFTAALACLTRCPLLQKQCQRDSTQIYRVLLDSFEEYRFMKNELRQMHTVCPELSDISQCPACPQTGGTLVFSIDGHFGLCRKQKAGKSVRPPLNEGRLFEPQSAVDEFVRGYPTVKTSGNKECNEFLAGNLLRSKGRYHALDETGVIGVACRHEFPLRMYSLRHGERISYIVYCLEMLKSTCSASDKVLLLYDVACILKQHLERRNKQDLLQFFDLAVPVFHAYGHKVDCQLAMSPRYRPGFGLSDGEVCERIWSYMRRFARMTKEMRPSHRIDVLTDALLHFCRLSSGSLKKLLPKRLLKAQEVAKASRSILRKLMDDSPVSFDEQEVLLWLADEKEATKKKPEWNELTKYSGNDPGHILSLTTQLTRLERKMKEIESVHGIQIRWTEDSSEYQSFEHARITRKKQQLLDKLGVCARERWYMLNVKAKFAEGHYMASRISKAITKESEKLKTTITEYNSLVSPTEKLSWEQVTDLSLSLVHTPSEDAAIPRCVRMEAIGAISKMQRATEECALLHQEMENVVRFHCKQHEKLGNTIKQLQLTESHSVFVRGAACLLQLKQGECLKEISGCLRAFPQSAVPSALVAGLPEAAPQEGKVLVVDDQGLVPTTSISESQDGNWVSGGALNCNSAGGSEADEQEFDQLTASEAGDSEQEFDQLTASEDGSEAERQEFDTFAMSRGDTTVLSTSIQPSVQSPVLAGDSTSISGLQKRKHILTDTELSDFSDGSEDEEDENLNYARRLERLEKEAFLKTVHQNEDQELLSKADKDFLHTLSLGRKKEGPLKRRRMLYADWSKQKRQRILELSRENIQLANVMARGPYFTVMDKSKH